MRTSSSSIVTFTHRHPSDDSISKSAIDFHLRPGFQASLRPVALPAREHGLWIGVGIERAVGGADDVAQPVGADPTEPSNFRFFATNANGAIFENSQGRFTSGPWDNWEAYSRNSPVKYAPNVTSPLLMLHNDADGAVDFTQGVEYFNTLRRLGKPVWMVEYPGENHGLARQPNMQDYMLRMKEFFDHYLLGRAGLDVDVQDRGLGLSTGQHIGTVELAHRTLQDP